MTPDRDVTEKAWEAYRDFDFRYNYRKANGYNDEQRAEMLLRGVVGKRLTYETTTV